MRLIPKIALALLIAALPATANPFVAGLIPDLKQYGRPSWVKPGARIVWWSTSRSEIVVNGKLKKSAGVGPTELTVVAVAGDMIAVNVRSFLSIGGTEHEAPTPSGSYGGLVPAAGAEFWVHPHALQALLKSKPVEGVSVGRLVKTFNGNKMTVVLIDNKVDSWMYDLASGVLVSKLDQTSREEYKKTNVIMASTEEFRAFQRVNYPWLNAKIPAWTGRVKEYTYAGSIIMSTPGMEPIVQPFSLKHTLVRGGDTWFMTSVVAENPNQQASPAKPAPAMSGIGTIGICLPPKELAKLQVGTVLARNKYIQSETSVAFVGEREGKHVAVLTEKAPGFTNEWHFDLRSGVLFKSRFFQPAHNMEYRFTLSGTK